MSLLADTGSVTLLEGRFRMTSVQLDPVLGLEASGCAPGSVPAAECAAAELAEYRDARRPLPG
jgi:hypothetical protein